MYPRFQASPSYTIMIPGGSAHRVLRCPLQARSLQHVAPLCLSTSLGLFENQLQPLESLDSARSSYQAQSQAAVAQVLLFEEDCGKQWCLRIWSQNILPFCCYSIPFLPMSLHSLHCLTWSLHKEPLWRMHRVPSGPRFPMYLAVPQARCICKQCDLRRSDGFWNQKKPGPEELHRSAPVDMCKETFRTSPSHLWKNKNAPNCTCHFMSTALVNRAGKACWHLYWAGLQ